HRPLGLADLAGVLAAVVAATPREQVRELERHRGRRRSRAVMPAATPGRRLLAAHDTACGHPRPSPAAGRAASITASRCGWWSARIRAAATPRTSTSRAWAIQM